MYKMTRGNEFKAQILKTIKYDRAGMNHSNIFYKHFYISVPRVPFQFKCHGFSEIGGRDIRETG
jgi:hypothetical protein